MPSRERLSVLGDMVASAMDISSGDSLQKWCCQRTCSLQNQHLNDGQVPCPQPALLVLSVEPLIAESAPLQWTGSLEAACTLGGVNRHPHGGLDQRIFRYGQGQQSSSGLVQHGGEIDMHACLSKALRLDYVSACKLCTCCLHCAGETVLAQRLAAGLTEITVASMRPKASRLTLHFGAGVGNCCCGHALLRG